MVKQRIKGKIFWKCFDKFGSNAVGGGRGFVGGERSDVQKTKKEKNYKKKKKYEKRKKIIKKKKE